MTFEAKLNKIVKTTDFAKIDLFFEKQESIIAKSAETATTKKQQAAVKGMQEWLKGLRSTIEWMREEEQKVAALKQDAAWEISEIAYYQRRFERA